MRSILEGPLHEDVNRAVATVDGGAVGESQKVASVVNLNGVEVHYASFVRWRLMCFKYTHRHCTLSNVFFSGFS